MNTLTQSSTEFNSNPTHAGGAQPPLSALLPDLRRFSRREKHGPCWRCGGTDRFIAFDTGRGWCRQCNWKGDAIQLLRDRDGLTFQEAKRQLGLNCSLPSRRVHTVALAAVTQAYRAWQRDTLTALTDQYRELTDELEMATIAFRAIHRAPHLYTEEEKSYWTRTLGIFYDRHATLEHHLDILTYSQHAASQFAWWQEVTRG